MRFPTLSVIALSLAVSSALASPATDALDAAVAQVKAELAAKDKEIAELKKQPTPIPTPPPTTAFNPRTMSLTDIQAQTGRTNTSAMVTRGATTISAPGTYENVNYTGRVTICADNVMFRQNKVKGDVYYAILVDDRCVSRPTNIVIEHNDISDSTNCIAGVPTIVRRNDLGRCDNGANLWRGFEISENYIHIGDYSPGGSPHYDGIENNGTGGFKFLKNYIVVSAGQTAAIMLNDEFGTIMSGQIDGNYLAGGGYTVYCDDTKSGSNVITGVTITNNTVKKGAWGHGAFYTSSCSFDSTNSLQ